MTGLSLVSIPDLFSAEHSPAEDPALVEKSRAALLALFRDNVVDVTQCRHLAVDVQRGFCDAAQAAHIIDDIAPALKSLGIGTDWFYFEKDRSAAEEFTNDLYKTKVEAGDRILDKPGLSAFTVSGYDDGLRQEKKKILLVTGFGYSACVRATVLDARKKGYHVILFKDATNFRSRGAFRTDYATQKAVDRELTDAGAIIADSADVLPRLKAATGGPAP